MNMILTLISSHLLSVIEASLISNEPEIVAAIEKELELLVTKIESYLSKKSPSVASVVTPILTAANNVADTAIVAAGNAALAQSSVS